MKGLLISAVAGALLTSGAAISAQVRETVIDIKAPDGVVLKGTYFSPGRPGPAILMLHQCNMDRHAWDGLARDIAAAGIHAVTFDYRGYGESGGEKLTDAAKRRPVMAGQWPGDVDAAYAYLLARDGVDKAHLGAVGASCGVVQTGELATRHHEIRTLVLLSWYSSDAARAYIASTPSIAVFGAAADEDTAGPESIRIVANNSVARHVRELVKTSGNASSVVKTYPGTEHGVPMFAKNPELQPMIVGWLKRNLFAATATR